MVICSIKNTFKKKMLSLVRPSEIKFNNLLFA